MNRFTLLLTLLLVGTCGLGAAAETNAERDAAYAALFDMNALIDGGTITPHWLDGGAKFWYAKGDTDNREVLVVNTVTGERSDYFDVTRLREALAKVLDEDLPGTGVPFASFETGDDGHITFTACERRFTLDPKSYAIEESMAAETEDSPTREPSDSMELPSPNGQWLAVIRNYDLYLETPGGRESLRLTETGTEIAAWETYGAAWSADGAHLLVPVYDLTDVNEIPLVDWLDPAAPVSEEPYPSADGATYRTHLHHVSVAQASVTPLNLAEAEFDNFTPLGLTPDGKAFLLIRTDRTASRLDLLAVDAATGAAAVLISETRDTFLGGPCGLYSNDWYLTPVGDDKHFVWMSNRDGQYHDLYLYDYAGQLVRRLTADRFPIFRIVSIDTDHRWIYYLAKPDLDDPYSRQLCRIDLDGNRFRQLTHATGRHAIRLDPNFTGFIDNHSDADRPPCADLRLCDGTLVRRLETADISRLEATGWTPPERVTVKAADGVTDIWVSIHRPPGFDPNFRYPVIEMIYAGPQWSIVPDMFVRPEYGETAAALSRLGYVTVIIDGRGLDGRGRDFHAFVHRRLGQIEIPDHAAALRNLAKTRPWLDLDRVGIHGKSWGGYFTLRALLTAPELYKVGVASAAVVDLATTIGSPIVPYMGLPADNTEGYAAADCLSLADKLAGDLLITIGTGDHNTPFGQSMRMLKAFNDADKDVEILVLPGDNHWLRGSSFPRWQRAMRDYFMEKMPPVALGD